MNSQLPSSIIICCCLSLLCTPLNQAHAKSEYLRVDAEQLLANPQKYWARPIIFQDVLTSHPSDEGLKIGDQKYYQMGTLNLGSCHADPSVIGVLRTLPINREYMFSGTVLQREVGFFGSRSEFHVVINRFQMVVGSVDELGDELQGLLATAPRRNASDIGQLHVEKLLELVQAALVSYAEEKDVELWELFESGGEHAEAVIANIRAGIRAAEADRGASTIDMLSNLLWYLLEPNYPSPKTPALADDANSSPTMVEEPGMMPVDDEEATDNMSELFETPSTQQPRVQTEDVADAPAIQEDEQPSWWARRKARRAEKAEQERITKEQEMAGEENPPVMDAPPEQVEDVASEEELPSWRERRAARKAAKAEKKRLAKERAAEARAMKAEEKRLIKEREAAERAERAEEERLAKEREEAERAALEMAPGDMNQDDGLSWLERRAARRAEKERSPEDEEVAAAALEREMAEQELQSMADTETPEPIPTGTSDEELISEEELAAQERALQEAAMNLSQQADTEAATTVEEVVDVEAEEAEIDMKASPDNSSPMETADAEAESDQATQISIDPESVVEEVVAIENAEDTEEALNRTPLQDEPMPPETIEVAQSMEPMEAAEIAMETEAETIVDETEGMEPQEIAFASPELNAIEPPVADEDEIVVIEDQATDQEPFVETALENTDSLSSWFPRWTIQWAQPSHVSATADGLPQSETYTLDPTQPIPLRRDL